MTDNTRPRYPGNQVRYIDLAVTKTDTGCIVAGAHLTERTEEKTPTGIPWHRLLHVYSLYYGPDVAKPLSNREALSLICADIAKTLPPDIKFVVFRSDMPQFNKWRSLGRQLKEATGLDVAIKRVPRLSQKISGLMMLANDALARGYSVDCAIEPAEKRYINEGETENERG